MADDLTFAASGTINQALTQPLVMGPQPTAPQVPVHFQQPEALRQQQPTQNFESVGQRKRADRRSIVSGLAGFVKASTDFANAKKTQDLQLHIETLMSAQQGYQEALQTGDQEALKKNAAIINRYWGDPKIAKQLAKAFDIKLFPGMDGKPVKSTPENKALTQAYQEFQKKQQSGETPLNANAQVAMQQTPQRLQESPQQKAQAAAIADKTAPSADELAKVVATVKAAEITAKGKTDVQTEKNEEADKVKKMYFDGVKLKVDAENHRADQLFKLGQEKIQSNNNNVQAKIVSAERIATSKNATTLQKQQAVNQVNIYKAQLGVLDAQQKAYEQRYKANVDTLTKAQNDLAKMSVSQDLFNSDAAAKLNQTIADVTADNDKLTQAMQQSGQAANQQGQNKPMAPNNPPTSNNVAPNNDDPEGLFKK